MKPFQPMLAAPIRKEKGESITQLRFPLIASPKFDGIRALVIDGRLKARSLDDIPNKHLQETLSFNAFSGLDGEIITYTDGKMDKFSVVSGHVRREDGRPNFLFHVFDLHNFPVAYNIRDERLRVSCATWDHDRIKYVQTKLVRDLEELMDYSTEQLELGYEGTMVRSPTSPYKHGRATFKEGWLTKIKPFEDADAQIVGFEEMMHNGNEATTNALGRTERSSHKENLTPMGTLGKLICRDEKNWPGQTFKIGTGFSAKLRQEIWNDRGSWLEDWCKYKFQRIGSDSKPRSPVFQGRREKFDR